MVAGKAFRAGPSSSTEKLVTASTKKKSVSRLCAELSRSKRSLIFRNSWLAAVDPYRCCGNATSTSQGNGSERSWCARKSRLSIQTSLTRSPSMTKIELRPCSHLSSEMTSDLNLKALVRALTFPVPEGEERAGTALQKKP